MRSNEQLVVVYPDARDARRAHVYTTVYDREQAREALRACAELHGVTPDLRPASAVPFPKPF